MYNMDDLIKEVKKAALEAIGTSKPSDIVFGTVLSASPLEIQIDSKKILKKAQLCLTRNVTEYWVEVTVEHETESGTTDHSHPYKGRKKFLVHNELLAGEQVVLAQRAGGQQYVVLDRIPKE